MATREQSSKRTFVNLDFMRSVAVLLVASSHLLLYTGRNALGGWWGITGVSIFFVHTTLVLMWSLERDANIGRFYLRRAFRIYPLWLAVLGLTILTRLPMSPPFAPGFGFYHAGPKELLFNVLLLFNLQFGANIVGASWTLPLEVQMYIFLPCLFFFARNSRQLWPLLFIDAFIALYDFKSYPAINSALPMCVPFFLPGVVAYVLGKRPNVVRLPGWSFAVFLLTLVILDYPYGTFRRSWLFCLVLGLALPLFRDMKSDVVRVASHYVAKYSYGIYLSHMAAIAVSVHVLRAEPMLVRILSFIALFVGLPIAFYHAVEEPMIRLGAHLAGKIGRGPAPRINERSLELEMVP